MIPSPRLYGVPCWIMPIFAGFAWLTTLTSMLFLWHYEGFRIYPEMGTVQRYAYISNVGASHLGKPVFQIGSFTTVVSFGVAFTAERWLRRKGRLLHHDSAYEIFLSRLATMFSTLGATGLIGLTIYDVRRQPHIHKPLIVLFIVGYIFAAVAICFEKSLLVAAHPTNPIILRSFRIKLVFIVLETILSLLFGYTFSYEIWDPSIFLEWTIAFLFTLYMWSFAIDFLDVPTLTVMVEDLGQELEEEKDYAARMSLGGRGIHKKPWDLERGVRQPRRTGRLRDIWDRRKRSRGYHVRLK